MADEPLISGVVDPLDAFNGPSLFPRTLRASTGDSVPIDSADLNSIHQFMMSLEFRSPEKLMTEAKKILDGGMTLLDSDLVSCAQKVNPNHPIVKEGMDAAKQTRKGLGITRKRAPFTLRTSVSQPSLSLEPTLNIDELEDPDEFFDAYERLEKAKREIKKQMGGKTSTINEYRPSTNTRVRRTGILGKTYSYKHRYPSAPFENDALLSSQEVEPNNPNLTSGNLQEKLITPDPNPDIDLGGIELAASKKKSTIEVDDILEELLSCNNEDLDGDGALVLLQERLQIEPLDLENLRMPEFHDIQRNAVFSAGKIKEMSCMKSLMIDNVLKNADGKQSVDQERMTENTVVPVVLQTSPRSPFASLSSLQKRMMQSNPLKDSFSPQNVDISTHQSVNRVEPTDKLHEQLVTSTGLKKDRELKSLMEREITESTDSYMDAHKLIGSTDDLPKQSVDENTCMESKEYDARSDVDPVYNIEEPTDFGNTNDDQSNAFMLEDEALDASSRRPQYHATPLLEVRQTRLRRLKHEANDELTKPVTPIETGMRRSKRIKLRPLEGESHSIKHVTVDQPNVSELEDEPKGPPSGRQQFNAAQQPKVHQVKQSSRNREVGGERLRKFHPRRESLAECGTSFETGVRRSKRIKMRPLEFWKGERFLFGRVNDSLKLIGVKYFSPGKGSRNNNLKVKSFVASESSAEYKDLLEFTARH